MDKVNKIISLCRSKNISTTVLADVDKDFFRIDSNPAKSSLKKICQPHH
jgi:hypothetical protein